MQQSTNGPVFLRVKGFDFFFALDDQTQAHRLHATRRPRAGEFAPEDWGELEAHQIIQSTTRQVGLNQRLVDLTRVLHCFGHGSLGDRVENHAADGRVFLNGATLAQGLFEVPRNRLSFAIGVGREDQVVVVFQGVRDGFDMFAAVVSDLPSHGEIIVRVDRSVFRR